MGLAQAFDITPELALTPCFYFTCEWHPEELSGTERHLVSFWMDTYWTPNLK
jgi:hypothetical protein